jgi:hypothetical protein
VDIQRQVQDRSAWRAAEMAASTDWVWQLTDAQLDELGAAVDFARARGLDPMIDGAAAFPLPSLARQLHELVDELDNGRGFLLLRGLNFDGYSSDDIDMLYAGIGCHMGRIITQTSRGNRIGRVTDGGADYGSVATRGHTSSDAIRPHCDSADVVGLLCVQPALAGGESTVASATAIYNIIAREHPHCLPTLTRGFRINLAGKGPTGEASECSNHVIPVFSDFAGKISCRFNHKQIEDAANILGTPLSDLEHEAIALMGTLAVSDELRLDMDFRRGDIQFLNNHVILHARRAYQDWPDTARRRLLLRMWINVDSGRPLAPEFADRLNSGPRGEVTVLAAHE